MTAGNDVVDLSKWNGTLSVNIGDAFSGDNDKVTVMANALAGAVAKDNLKLTSVENLEIVNSGVVETPVILKGANFKGLEAVKLIGDATILNVSDFTQGVKIDATANADYIIGSSKADTINGGAGNDTIQGNQGNDVLTGGNGADTFVVGNAKDFGVDQILDFSAEDKISLGGGAYTVKELKKFDASTFSTVTYKTLDSVLATFADGGANATGSGNVVIFSYDGKTYALLANGPFSEATDALVDITGANVASLTESNFGEAVSLYTYENYTAFTQGAANIPAGEAIIKTMTVTEAGALAINNDLLAKVADGGIKAITGDGSITVTMPSKAGASVFDARTFDAKLFDGAVPAAVKMSIEGSNGNDSIFASELGGTITGGSGADVITAGASKDTFVQAKDTSVTPTTIRLSSKIAAGDTLTFANGVDIIQGFGSNDVIKGGSSTATSVFGSGTDSVSTDGETCYLSGNFVDNTFTVTDNGVGADTLVFIANGTKLSAANQLSGAVVLVGVNSDNLSNNNFEA